MTKCRKAVSPSSLCSYASLLRNYAVQLAPNYRKTMCASPQWVLRFLNSCYCSSLPCTYCQISGSVWRQFLPVLQWPTLCTDSGSLWNLCHTNHLTQTNTQTHITTLLSDVTHWLFTCCKVSRESHTLLRAILGTAPQLRAVNVVLASTIWQEGVRTHPLASSTLKSCHK